MATSYPYGYIMAATVRLVLMLLLTWMLTCIMAMKYDTGPEPTRQDYPEVALLREPQIHQSQQYEQRHQETQIQPYDQQHQASSQQDQQWQQQHQSYDPPTQPWPQQQTYNQQTLQWQQQQQQQQPQQPTYHSSHHIPYTDSYHSRETLDGTEHKNPFESAHSAPSSINVPSPYHSRAQPSVSTTTTRVAATTTTAPRKVNKPVPLLAMKICGCSFVVFVLSCIIALLSAAAIGLAAATGIESQRANENANRLASVLNKVPKSTVVVTSTTSTSTATPTSLNLIDDGCAENTKATEGSTYVAYSQFGSIKFKRYCNRDAGGEVIYSLFTSSFSTCMDACAAYTMFISGNFGSNQEKATCTAVSFIPEWVDKAKATLSNARGNCYMKSGPQNSTTLAIPNKEIDVHAAIPAIGT